jgi:plasmid stabilization system protein ParE
VKIELHPEALSEVQEAAVWYERQRRGLGDALLECVNTTLVRILAAPRAMPKHAADVRLRRALVGRFPYAVVFALLDDTVYVVAFAHGRRRPGYWKKRVPHGQ